MPPKICFDIENEARRTLAYILAGILAIIGIYMAHRRIRALEDQVRVSKEQLQVAQEGQITERFTRAIEQLGSPEMAIRLGGIYALERIAKDSDKDYWAIMETLTAFVRENAPWREPPSKAPAEAVGEEAAVLEALIPEDAAGAAAPAPAASPKPATDIQAILWVLGRRKYRFGQEEEKGRLDLRQTYLRGADLTGTHLEGANLGFAHLERADLRAAHLEGAVLWDARLERANLVGSRLEGADLWGAHLEGAVLTGAHLEGANLRAAHLEGAYLRKAHLEGANLGFALLERAHLGGATGLTREQMAKAFTDDKTILPDYLQEQRPEDKGPEGESGE